MGMSKCESRPTGYLPILVGCWGSLYLSYKRVLLKSVVSIVFDGNPLLPFNPTYVLLAACVILRRRREPWVSLSMTVVKTFAISW